MKLVLLASDVQIGFLGALGAAAGVFAFPIVGALNDRFGRKPFILAGSLLLTCTCVAMLFIEEVGPLLYLVRIAQGVSFALLFNSATTLVSDNVEPMQLGRALALFGASMLATNALSPAIAEPIADTWGWPAVFWMSIGWGVLAMVCGPFVQEQQKPLLSRGQAASTSSLLRDPRVRRVVLLIATGGAGFGTIFIFHQPFAISLGITKVSGFFVAYALFALSVRFLVISRVDAWGRQRASAVSLFVYACAVFSTAFLRPGMLEPIGAVMGLAHGVFYPVFNALAVEGVPISQRGSMMALYHGGFNAGMALALLFGGAVAERLGYPALFLFVALITFMGALGLFKSDLSVRRPTLNTP